MKDKLWPSRLQKSLASRGRERGAMTTDLKRRAIILLVLFLAGCGAQIKRQPGQWYEDPETHVRKELKK